MKDLTNRVELMREAFERGKKAVLLRPTVGQGTAITKVRLTDGYTCEVEDGAWKLVVDMAEKHGGANSGPNSGVIGRGALGSCLAIGYARWAVVMNIPIESLEVEVQTDYDVRGELGLADITPSYTGIRYTVRIESPAPREEVQKMLDRADMLSPYLDIFANPHKIDRIVEYRQSVQAEEEIYREA